MAAKNKKTSYGDDERLSKNKASFHLHLALFVLHYILHCCHYLLLVEHQQQLLNIFLTCQTVSLADLHRSSYPLYLLYKVDYYLKCMTQKTKFCRSQITILQPQKIVELEVLRFKPKHMCFWMLCSEPLHYFQ